MENISWKGKDKNMKIKIKIGDGEGLTPFDLAVSTVLYLLLSI